MDPSAVSGTMAVSWAQEDSCDLAISIASSSVNLTPFEINFSLTLSEFVLRTTHCIFGRKALLNVKPWHVIYGNASAKGRQRLV